MVRNEADNFYNKFNGKQENSYELAATDLKEVIQICNQVTSSQKFMVNCNKFKQEVWKRVCNDMDMKSCQLPLKKLQELVKNEATKFYNTYNNKSEESQEPTASNLIVMHNLDSYEEDQAYSDEKLDQPFVPTDA